MDRSTTIQLPVGSLSDGISHVEREISKDSWIAIVGMAFRFPGGLNDEAGLWSALKEGRDAVGRLGSNRWAVDEFEHPKRAEPGRSITFSAGVLSGIDEFDAAFFGISPREAAWLDPQQRLLLELAWEAIENGGHAPASLAGSDCAVFVGISGLDYGMRGLDDLASVSAYSVTGNTLSIAANRLSYFLDLRGPSLAIDTACSSSLVAVHCACNALRSGEASTALVGGVNLLLHPYPFIGFSKASMLSATGRCRAFDAAGDGYVRAEGCAVLWLKPYTRALADGDDIQAVILASGSNADGGRKTGMTIPSVAGQADLMRGVLGRSGLAPGDVDFIEAHGTGTAVGDPVEAAAIGAVYGRARPAGQPLPIGSVKTNLGHLESASGMAGLVKTILALKNRAVPASLHFDEPNPTIPLAELNLEVVTRYREFPDRPGRLLVAGVNSFGFGGANAHVLVREHRVNELPPWQGDLPTPPLFLSARTLPALRQMAGRYAELLRCAADGASYYDIAHAAGLGRERLEKRLAVRSAAAGTAADALGSFAQGETVDGVVLEDRLLEAGKVAFVYSGNGSQWVGMARRLLRESAGFAECLAELDAPIQALTGFSILAELHAEDEASQLADTAVAQPLLFAIQVGLTRLLREQGVEPSAVAGHSVGEVAAAWAAGLLSLDQAIAVICARSKAQALTRGSGRMAAVGVSEAAMAEILATGECGDVEVVGINGPKNLTIAGGLVHLERVRGILEPRSVAFRLLDLDYAFHSRRMDRIRGPLLDSLGSLRPGSSSAVRFVSTVSGDLLDGAALDAHYWWLNVRKPVLFASCVSRLAGLGCRVFVEIGPHAILQRYMVECLGAQGIAGRVMPTLRKGHDGSAAVEDVVLRAHLLVDTLPRRVFFPVAGRRVRLPAYPWQRERHWQPRTSEGYHLIERCRVHPLLGWRLTERDGIWENVVDPAVQTWLGDHRVGGAVVLPASAYVEMALAAACEGSGSRAVELEDLDILVPMVFDGEHARSVRLEYSSRDGSFQIRSRQRLSEDAWLLNACGRLLGPPASAVRGMGSHHATVCASVVEPGTHYRLAAAIGLDYGPAFRGLGEARLLADGTLTGELDLPESLVAEAARYLLHPALLDVCFQSLVDFFQADIEAGQGIPLLPVKVGRLFFEGAGCIASFHVQLRRRGRRSVSADFELRDADGRVIAILLGCRFRAAPLQHRAAHSPTTWRIEPTLVPHPLDQRSIRLPDVTELSGRLRAGWSDEEGRLGRAAYFNEALPLFEALAVSFACAAFREIAGEQGEWLQNALSGQPSLAAPPGAYFRWLAGCLRQEGLLAVTDGQWRLETADLPAPEEIWRTLLREHPSCLPDLVSTARVGRHLAELLRGKVDGGAFRKQLRASPSVESQYDDSPTYLGTRLAVQQLLSSLAADSPEDRRLRILEIAAGGSSLPRRLGGSLADDRLDYVFASSDEDVCSRMRREYVDHPFVVVASIGDDDAALAADLPLPGLFDIVVLRHWVHAVRKPAVVLSAVGRRLAAGGLIVVAERHPDLCADFLDGIDPEWWYDDPAGARPVSRLLSPNAWANALADQGFEEIETVSEPAAGAMPGGGYVVLAKRPTSASPAVEPPESRRWLLVADAGGPVSQLADLLMRLLESNGQRVALGLAGATAAFRALSDMGASDAETVVRMIAAARDHVSGIEHVVYLAGSGASARDADSLCSGLFHLVRDLAAGGPELPRLWVVTEGGALSCRPPGGSRVDPAQAALWGFGRVVMNEHPSLSCTLIDLGGNLSCREAGERLCRELLWPDGEDEIVLTETGRFALRLEHGLVAPGSVRLEDASRFSLDFRMPGQLHDLAWKQVAVRSLADDEVEVRTVAAGLNFRDVMYAMGLLPDEAVENGFAGATLGLEFSGVVTRVGSAVRDFAPGDAVMGFGPACLSSHVVTAAKAVAAKPPEWSFEAAATVPTAFFTVYYALKHLADLQPGERVLIHGAAGGVGIAAVQLARAIGAEVFATAGSDEKRDFVRLLGADHVFDSRTLSYADEILAVTDGEGVDVVLNSLAGEAIRRNLQVLKPFGRFLELGKRDFFENTPIGLRRFKDNISYFGIDADQLLDARPERAAGLFREVMQLFADGVLSPLPCRVFPAERVVDAFRFMQQSRHIGKLVVAVDGVPVVGPPAAGTRPQPPLARASTFLVTGGVSGFALESARWLAEQGVGQLVLLSRRGMAAPGAAEAVADLSALGARVEVVACDVTDRSALLAVLDHVRRDLPPLKGVLHAAMVLDDALIAQLDVDRFARVLAPKVTGARLLHELTLDLALDHFVLYSSITTFIGNPGQANYVAANAYLEGLAAHRRSLGLPATCIGWGPIGDAGYLARNQAVRESLAARLGAALLTARGALAMLGPMLESTQGTSAVAEVDWHSLARLLPSAQGPRFAGLRRRADVAGGANETAEDLRSRIGGKSAAEVAAIVRDLVRLEVAQILCLDVERIDPVRSLHDLGMDSLMGVELALALEKRSGIQLPAMMLGEGPTVERVAARIVEHLLGRDDAEQESPSGRVDTLISELAEQHGEVFSDDEIAVAAASFEQLSRTGVSLIR